MGIASWFSLRWLRNRLWRQSTEGSSQLPASAPVLPTLRVSSTIEEWHCTTGVLETLDQEYQEHQQSDRGDEELGWVLLGERIASRAIVQATLPAGANRQASATHIRFNATAQAVAVRLLFAQGHRLQLLGLVHTHPGQMRQPSSGDLQGDQQWILQLPGQQALFGIGTVKHSSRIDLQSASANHRFDWYTLSTAMQQYQAVRLTIVEGQDVATILRRVWPILETHADAIERLSHLFKKLQLGLLNGAEPGIVIKIPLPAGQDYLQVILQNRSRKWIYSRDERLYQPTINSDEPLEKAIFQFLTEWASRLAPESA